MKLATSPRNRKSAKRLFLREKSLRSKNPSLTSVSAIIAGATGNASEYAKQLREKQKVRRMYGLGESQFIKYYKLASTSKQNSAERLLQLLELRLDNVIYRAGFGTTRSQSRQFASHGWFKVNGTRVNIPSYMVKEGDVISVARKTVMFEDRTFDNVPEWLSLDKKKSEVKVMRTPLRTESDPDINEQLIVEYYSR